MTAASDTDTTAVDGRYTFDNASTNAARQVKLLAEILDVHSTTYSPPQRGRIRVAVTSTWAPALAASPGRSPTRSAPPGGSSPSTPTPTSATTS